MTRSPLPRALFLLGLLALTACETIEGAGRDLQTTGAVISQEARKTQSQM